MLKINEVGWEKVACRIVLPTEGFLTAEIQSYTGKAVNAFLFL